jgi:hypothetical protein
LECEEKALKLNASNKQYKEAKDQILIGLDALKEDEIAARAEAATTVKEKAATAPRS